MSAPARRFVASPAVRHRVPLLVGLTGPSSSGKTMSALELATGIQSVTGGKILGVDTEAGRMLHYADRYSFEHVPFGPPFAPADYAAVIEYAVEQGASVVIVDSQSHEHEGPGGVLEMHASELERLTKGDADRRDKMNMLAWAKPKQQRRRLINTILQAPCNFVFCFRAKPKLKLPKKGDKDREPKDLGFQPIAGEEFIYEMTVNCLLLPGAQGVPSWHPEELGEKALVKLPEWAKPMFPERAPLSAKTGALLAEWAAGTKRRTPEEMMEAYATCADPGTLGSLQRETKAMWRTLGEREQELLKTANEDAKARLAAATGQS